MPFFYPNFKGRGKRKVAIGILLAHGALIARLRILLLNRKGQEASVMQTLSGSVISIIFYSQTLLFTDFIISKVG